MIPGSRRQRGMVCCQQVGATGREETLQLICERDVEIEAFAPPDCWIVVAENRDEDPPIAQRRCRGSDPEPVGAQTGGGIAVHGPSG